MQALRQVFPAVTKGTNLDLTSRIDVSFNTFFDLLGIASIQDLV